MSATLNQRKPGTLLSNMIKNLQKDSHCLNITTQSCLSIVDPPFSTVEVPKNDNLVVDKTPTMEVEKVKGLDASIGEDTCNGKVDEPTSRQNQKFPSSFP